MVASHLGLMVAKGGFRTTLVDLDTGGANLHVLFGHFHPTVTLTDFLDRKIKTLQGVVQPLSLHPNLSLISRYWRNPPHVKPSPPEKNSASII